MERTGTFRARLAGGGGLEQGRVTTAGRFLASGLTIVHCAELQFPESAQNKDPDFQRQRQYLPTTQTSDKKGGRMVDVEGLKLEERFCVYVSSDSLMRRAREPASPWLKPLAERARQRGPGGALISRS
jgi:hypothetical protein